jgi:hypothetical protein
VIIARLAGEIDAGWPNTGVSSLPVQSSDISKSG